MLCDCFLPFITILTRRRQKVIFFHGGLLVIFCPVCDILKSKDGKYQEMTEEKEMTALIKKALAGERKNTEEKAFGNVHMLPIAAIYPNPAQPRKDFDDEKLISLAESVLRYGIIQPLTVRFAADFRVYPQNTPLEKLSYELVAGERRLRAAKIAGLSEVPCIIVDADGRESAELALIENLQREDLDIFEQAEAIRSLIEIYSATQEQAAAALGMSQSAVANKLRLLKLTLPERNIISEYSLTERHARAVLKLKDPEQRLALLAYAGKRQLNVSETEELVAKRLTAPEPAPQKRKTVIKDLRIFYNTLDRAIDTMEKSGIGVEKLKNETDSAVELIIRIKKGS